MLGIKVTVLRLPSGELRAVLLQHDVLCDTRVVRRAIASNASRIRVLEVCAVAVAGRIVRGAAIRDRALDAGLRTR